MTTLKLVTMDGTPIGDKEIKLLANTVKAQGGEAVIHDLGDGNVFKLFKPPNHPDFQDNALAQQMAKVRLEQHQTKLKAFPSGLPANIVAPNALGINAAGKVVGYRMPFLKDMNLLFEYGKIPFQIGMPRERIRDILLSLYDTVSGAHTAQSLFGDFNDLNVLVPATGTQVAMIDADSMEFGGYRCTVFTERFVDPLLCDPGRPAPLLCKAYTADADWYAYLVMCFQTLCFVHPYGGIYKPKAGQPRVEHPARPLHSISVFHENVGYPKKATPLGIFPDDLLHHWQQTFEHQLRGVVPRKLIESLTWTKCTSCGSEHARSVCPNCATAVPIAIKERISVRGSVTATRFFETVGTILYATAQNGKLMWLYHENGGFRREDGSIVIQGSIDPRVRYRIKGTSTILGKDTTVVTFTPNGQPERTDTDMVDQRAVFDANASQLFWTTNDQLRKSGTLGPEYVGDVISGLTHIWVGPTLGFGLYRANELTVAFVFNTETRGINDSVKIPKIRGQLVDAYCAFGKDRCWFFSTSQEGGQIVNRCTLVNANGTVEGTAEAIHGDGTWLSQIRGGAATGSILLMPSDNGVIQIRADQGKLIVAKEFPDTEPYVDTDSRLFVGSDGLYVVERKSITRLVIR